MCAQLNFHCKFPCCYDYNALLLRLWFPDLRIIDFSCGWFCGPGHRFESVLLSVGLKRVVTVVSIFCNWCLLQSRVSCCTCLLFGVLLLLFSVRLLPMLNQCCPLMRRWLSWQGGSCVCEWSDCSSASFLATLERFCLSYVGSNYEVRQM